MKFPFVALCLSGALGLSGCGGGGGQSDSPMPPPAPPVAPVTEDVRDPSVAKQWNELLLNAIRDDLARPTVHARNLFHASALGYDVWAAYSDDSSTYLLGKTVNGVACDLSGLPDPVDSHLAREEAISFAIYRLITHRFANSPGSAETLAAADTLMSSLGFDVSNTATNYATGDPAALGNHAADCYIRYGLNDGSNEENEYANQYYVPVNPDIEPEKPGNPDIIDLNRWQRIKLTQSIDQSGNIVENAPPFLSPEWGWVEPFALPETERRSFFRDGFEYPVYFDPGAPPQHSGLDADDYKETFSLVSIWSSHLDPTDGVTIDISPASLGNIIDYPSDRSGYSTFYDRLAGGDASTGYSQNPTTGAPYAPQNVLRGDYTRVLAEFWADGPDSETPPGHWFVIMNEVSQHPDFERRYRGAGAELGPLEWDVKAYFALGGAMHDAAIATWSIKGWYDYLRPISAIRALADRGQSSDPTLASYSPDGIPLEPGYIELVAVGDPLAGPLNEHVGKVKLLAWRGPDYIVNERIDTAGVDWILAENWWPYQRPSFVSPPFAGYVSGHSTYSRAAAEVLTELTGDPFFPGGMSEFDIEANNFLVFERGPSQSMTLQWATYRDAADQCSLSRIWGGIHPPVDDIPGRLIGEKVGVGAFAEAHAYIIGNR